MASVIKFTTSNLDAKNNQGLEDMYEYEIYSDENKLIAKITPEIEREDAFDFHRKYVHEILDKDGHWHRWGAYDADSLEDVDNWMLGLAEEQTGSTAFLYNQTEEWLKERMTEQCQVVWHDNKRNAIIYSCELIKDELSPTGEAWNLRTYKWDAYEHTLTEGLSPVYWQHNSATEALYELRDEDRSIWFIDTFDLNAKDWDYFSSAIDSNDIPKLEALVDACKDAKLKFGDTKRYGLDQFYHVLPSAKRLKLVEKFIDNGLTSKQLALAQNSSLNALLDPEYTQTPDGFIQNTDLAKIYFSDETYNLRESDKFITNYLEKLKTNNGENIPQNRKLLEESLEELNWLAAQGILYPSFDICEAHIKAEEDLNGIYKGQYVYNHTDIPTYKASMTDYADACCEYEKEANAPHEYKIKATKNGLDNVYYDVNEMRFTLYDKEGCSLYSAVIAQDNHLPDEVRRAMEVHSSELRQNPVRYRPLRKVVDDVRAETQKRASFNLESYLGEPTKRAEKYNAKLSDGEHTHDKKIAI